jgi:hypothetical protein
MIKRSHYVNYKVFLLVMVLTVFFSNGCSRITLFCSKPDVAEEEGIRHFQQIVVQIENYKANYGKYPEKTSDLGPNVFDDGVGYPNKNITGASGLLKPAEDYFDVKFYFDREKTCLTLIGNNRACEYTSTSGKWSCY